jgi:hypothetical protein
MYIVQCISMGFPRGGLYSSITTEPDRANNVLVDARLSIQYFNTSLYSPDQSIHLIHELSHPILLIKVPAAVLAVDH